MKRFVVLLNKLQKPDRHFCFKMINVKILKIMECRSNPATYKIAYASESCHLISNIAVNLHFTDLRRRLNEHRAKWTQPGIDYLPPGTPAVNVER